MLDRNEAAYLDGARGGNRHHFDQLVEPYRNELQVHCYRMLASLQDAEDLVQETLLRAWQRLDTFEGRASFRAWLYKIATNACLDALKHRARRVLPTTTYPPADPEKPFSPPTPDLVWLEPFPDAVWTEVVINPETAYSKRETIKLAFLVALQLLPPRQRAVLILRDVLEWRAKEVAALLNMTVSAVNSVLHRARSTLNKHYRLGESEAVNIQLNDETMHTLLERYVEAWEKADVATLTSLLKTDATFTMPPSSSWYRGQAEIGRFLRKSIFLMTGHQQWRLQPAQANTQPAFGLYGFNPQAGSYQAFAIQVLALVGPEIAAVTNFLNPLLFPRFGLPNELQ